VLIDDPQPADAAAVAQGDALLGVDLPGGVGPVGARGRGGGRAAGRGGPQAGGAEPALQGPLRGGVRAVLAAQQHPDQAGAPGGVLAAQLDGLAHQVGGVAASGGRGPVGGAQAGVAAEPEAAGQVADGALGQAEFGGDGRRGQAAAAAGPDGAAHGDRGGGGHGGPSQG